MSDDKKSEALAEAHAAMATAEFARANIEKYLQIHGADAARFVMKIGDSSHYVMKIADPSAHFVMKIADDAHAGIAKLIDESAELAAKTLQAFVDSRRQGQK